MSGFVKKLMATGAALTIGLSSVASADYYYGQNGCDPCCAPRFDSCCANWCDNLSFNVAWLYWRASGDELDYAVHRSTFFPAESLHDVAVAKEKRHNVKGDFDSGYRLGLGFDLPCRGWGVNVQWTHFDTTDTSHSRFDGHSQTDSRGELITSVGFPFFFYGATDLEDGEFADFRGKLKLRYNVVDIEFGKWCCCGDCVSFRPHAGFRFADIKEKFNDSLFFGGEGELRGYEAISYHHHNEFKGAGLRIGLDTNFCLCDGWSIFGRGAASTVWGTSHNKHNYVLGDTEIAPFYGLHSREKFHTLRFFTDLSVGLQWRTMACDCYPFTLEFAWEHHFLFGQHRPWSDNSWDEDEDANTSYKKRGDIALQGFTLNVGFDF